MPADRPSLLHFLTPGYWLTWLVYGYMRSIVLLPLSWQLALGRVLGRCLNFILFPKRRIADRNLAVCFPELSAQARKRLRLKHFESIGMAVTEMAMAWFGSEALMRQVTTINGAEHLQRALSRGKGVILFSAHFTTLEFPFAALKPLCPRVCGMYREQRNEMWNVLMHKGRRRNIDELFPKDSVRAMIRALKENAVVWYAPDQSYRKKNSALVPFFGVPAMTNTATSRIAAMTGATVLTFFCRRLDDNSGYVIDIGEPLENFPTDDLVADTTRLMQALADYVRSCPDQYCWIHQRFKGRPEPYPDIYGAPAS
ncbi:MAG: LpxL/LpxP family Kdo(2)-lipid IV(A) lauroyl/palmitoleoyl acyltransferase [Betaproteobacteria bacterium]|nr:LpxL/LpxP family Kdo(2)-lipid IV(A) lauroyl/palmitoleoyl acyltransferase [Betaproteobacteria bacterium]